MRDRAQRPGRRTRARPTGSGSPLCQGPWSRRL